MTTNVTAIRESVQRTVAITDSIETTGVIRYAEFSQGQIVLPVGLSTTSLTFYARAINGGSLVAAKSDAEPPVAISRTVAAGDSIPIPKDLSGAYEIAIVSDAVGPEEIEVSAKA